MARVFALFVVTFLAVSLTNADQLPVKPKLHDIIKRLHPFILPQTATTPSMVNDQTWNFTKPSDFAGNCINAMGDSIVTHCQKQAMSDWDPAKLNTSTSTIWETCCSAYEELSCYETNANLFCPVFSQKAVADYSRKVANYFHSAICQSISFDNWKTDCNKEVHAAKVANHTGNPDANPQFVHLPKDDGPEKACFDKLRTHAKGNLEKKCEDFATNKWDPNHRKYIDSAMVDSCCAIYDSLRCVLSEAQNNVCSKSELVDMVKYQQKSFVAFGQSICQAVPYSQYDKLCKGGSFATLPSIFTLVTALMLFFRINF